MLRLFIFGYSALGAPTALNALFGIDDVTIITLGNCANGALCFARAAGDASVGNYICHFYLPPV